MLVRENVPLAGYTSFKTGGNARFFVEVSDEEELKSALTYAQKNSLAVFVLGGGTNILINDEGFPGLVIRVLIKVLTFEGQGGDVRLIAGAGVNWDNLVAETVKLGLHGLENLSGIPGTVGAAPVQNIGAYGSEIKSTIEKVETLDMYGNAKNFTNEECDFSYRNSFFKTEEGRQFIITKVFFNLKKNAMLNTEYADVKKYFAEKKVEKPTVIDVHNAVLAIRAAKLPDIQKIGTAGSFFKNPIISEDKYKQLLHSFPDLPKFPAEKNFVKVPLGWILDNICHFKGQKQGNVGTYEKQALVVVAYPGATSKEVSNFAQQISKIVYEKTGISIEPEVQII